MEKLVTDFLDDSVRKCPDRIAFVDSTRNISYYQLRRNARALAKEIVNAGVFKKPIAVVMDKSISCIECFFGVAYSGNYYSLIDIEMPEARALKIVDAFEPCLFLTDRKNLIFAKSIANNKSVLVIEEILEQYDGKEIQLSLQAPILSSDVLYVLFTSGSTGIPKGVITPHRAIVSYTYAVIDAYRLQEDTIIGNQAPFYFVMSVFDIFVTIARKCQMHIIPRKYFAFPGMAIRYLQENHINTINWVPSAMSLLANVNGFDEVDISSLRTVLFGGEIMPIKLLKKWQNVLPDAAFFNSYGSTEVTEAGLYYEVNRSFKDEELLPIGGPYLHTEAMVLDNNDNPVKDTVGELCIRSDSLSYGYYGDFDLTAKSFIQNPCNKKYKDIIYRTGDLVKYNIRGELEYIGRKDYQIKHMGRRIELGEIEANISAIKGISECCCVYDANNKQIIAFFCGDVEENELGAELKKLLPPYMLPNMRVKRPYLPRNLNGKIDRTRLVNDTVKQ